MDGEWYGRIAEGDDAAAREVVVKDRAEQRQRVLLLPICTRGGDRLLVEVLADLRNNSMPLMSENCLSICIILISLWLMCKCSNGQGIMHRPGYRDAMIGSAEAAAARPQQLLLCHHIQKQKGANKGTWLVMVELYGPMI